MAAGLASLAGWAFISYGVPAICAAFAGPVCFLVSHVTAPEAAAAIGTVATLASHYVPDSTADIIKKANANVKALAAIMPGTYAEYPGAPMMKVQTNMVTKDGQQVD